MNNNLHPQAPPTLASLSSLTKVALASASSTAEASEKLAIGGEGLVRSGRGWGRGLEPGEERSLRRERCLTGLTLRGRRGEGGSYYVINIHVQ